MDGMEHVMDDIGAVVQRMGVDLADVGFDRHLDDVDLLGVILRSHMLVERELTAIIEQPLPHPERLRRQWSFIHRLELVAALGLLDEEDIPAYQYLDTLRNRAAHRLNYEVGINEHEALIDRLAEALASPIRAKFPAESFPEPLRHTLKLLILYVAIKRHGLQMP